MEFLFALLMFLQTGRYSVAEYKLLHFCIVFFRFIDFNELGNTNTELSSPLPSPTIGEGDLKPLQPYPAIGEGVLKPEYNWISHYVRNDRLVRYLLTIKSKDTARGVPTKYLDSSPRSK